LLGQLSTGLRGWVSTTASRAYCLAAYIATPASIRRISHITMGNILTAANCSSSERGQSKRNAQIHKTRATQIRHEASLASKTSDTATTFNVLVILYVFGVLKRLFVFTNQQGTCHPYQNTTPRTKLMIPPPISQRRRRLTGRPRCAPRIYPAYSAVVQSFGYGKNSIPIRRYFRVPDGS
jgi:hypothetical protein